MVFFTLALVVGGLAIYFAYVFARAPAPPLAAAPDAKPEAADPIDAFWQWWSTVHVEMAQAIDARAFDVWVEPLSERVHAMHENLAWELGAGRKSKHHLCVTSEGNSELRVMTERWVSRAPASDANWEFYPSRQPSAADAKLKLKLAGVELDFSDFRLKLDVDLTRLHMHVEVFHPRLAELDAGKRSLASFLFLDDALGEDGVERWIVGVEQSTEASDDYVDRAALLEAVRTLAEKGEDSFSLLEGEKDGKRVLAVVNFGIKRIDHLLMDVHLQVTIPYPTEREDGLYTQAVGQDIERLEEELLDRLGATALFIAHETRQGKRVIHLHTNATTANSATLSEWERENPSWDIEIESRSDPSWKIATRF